MRFIHRQRYALQNHKNNFLYFDSNKLALCKRNSIDIYQFDFNDTAWNPPPIATQLNTDQTEVIQLNMSDTE